MVEQIQAESVGKKLAGADQRHLLQRVELIRRLLTPARLCVPRRGRLCLRPLTPVRYSDPEAFSEHFSGIV
jgi:hypothetical protein